MFHGTTLLHHKDHASFPLNFGMLSNLFTLHFMSMMDICGGIPNGSVQVCPS